METNDAKNWLSADRVSHPDDHIADALGMVPEGMSVSRCAVKFAIMHEYGGGPERWAKIAEIALHDARGNDERSATFLLEVVDGGRRVPGADLGSFVDNELAIAGGCIDRLPDGSRKRELAVLRGYHLSIIKIAQGDLAGAAAGYDAQAAMSDDSLAKAQAAYMAAWCRMMAETYWCAEMRGIRMSPGFLEAFCFAGTQLVAASHGTDSGPRLKGNFIANVMLGYWLANDWTSVAAELSMKIDDLQRLVEPPHNLGAALGDGLGFAKTLRDYHESDRADAAGEGAGFGDNEKVSLEWRLWGWLLHLAFFVSIYDENCKEEGTRRRQMFGYARKIIDCPGVGGATARRLAKEILAAYPEEVVAGD